jgi:uncharacterized membrane protein AbrB (regulator of aidB expression)
MRNIILTLAIFAALNASAQHWNDTWDYAPDKQKHLVYTAKISFLATPIRTFRDFDNPKLLEGFAYGVLFGTGINVAKELYDWTGRGHASYHDIAYGMIGSVIGSGIGLAFSVLVKKEADWRNKKKLKL